MKQIIDALFAYFQVCCPYYQARYANELKHSFVSFVKFIILELCVLKHASVKQTISVL